MASCLFCQINNRVIPADIVYEDDACLVFKDIHPKAKVHLLLIPKKHIEHVLDLQREDAALMGHMLYCIQDIAKVQPELQEGFRMITNTGSNAGQEVYHLHFHILAN
ncbi:MAG: histidine triad nucleotide-binding protein [Endozoicomonadaceae bacterium]|nr:histidine triad nucleotide-binding protein [Endozoicomonadaceae bacterium]MBE8232522.1 histidine triad nucleotide-binding protein [Endozoicomonadaceae bacterium]